MKIKDYLIDLEEKGYEPTRENKTYRIFTSKEYSFAKTHRIQEIMKTFEISYKQAANLKYRSKFFEL